MTDIEQIESDMRIANSGSICSVFIHLDESMCEYPCRSCVKPSSEGFKWRGRKTSIPEAVNEVGEGIKPDTVNRPAHYTSGGIECIDAMTAAFGDEAVKDFCLCNAFKYLWRHRQKNGVEDLKKARWYLGRLIAEMEVEDDG